MMKRVLSMLLAVVLAVSCMIAVSVYALQPEDADTHTHTHTHTHTAANVLNEEEEPAVPDDQALMQLEQQKAEAEFESIYSVYSGETITVGAYNSVATYASAYTVSGTVLLPAGVTASSGDIIRVYVYEPMKESDGVKTDSSNSSLGYANAVLSADRTKATFSLTLPSGSYTFAVRYLSGNKNISGKMFYYTAQGVTPNECIADTVSVPSSKTIDFTLPKAESYITGTITDIPASAKYIGINLNTSSGAYQSSNYVYLPVAQGQTSLTYQVGVDKAKYYMWVNHSGSGWYGTSSGLTSEWEERRILDTTEPITNLNISAKTPQAVAQCEVTVKFAQPLTEEKQYVALIFNKDFKCEDSSSWFTATKGATQAVFSVDKPQNVADGQKYYLAYQEITGVNSVSMVLSDSCRFYSVALGYTSDKSKATDISGMSNITIQEPTSYTVSGTLNEKNGNNTIGTWLYVGAEFEDEMFYTRARLGGTYRIDIPERMKNKSFKLFTAAGSGKMMENSKTYSGGERTLTGSLSGITVTSVAFQKVTGTVTVPTAAPKDGLNVAVDYVDKEDYDYYDAGTVTLKKGQTSAEYSIWVPEFIKNGYINAQLSAYEKVNLTSSAESQSLTDIDLGFYQTVTISGMVSLPSGMTADKDITVRVGASGRLYAYDNVTIPKGKSSAKYELQVRKDAEVNSLYTAIEAEDSGWMPWGYYDKNGTPSSDYQQFGETVTADMTLNLTLIRCAYIQGVISFADNAMVKGGTLDGYVRAVAQNSGKSYDTYIDDFSTFEDINYKISVPDDPDETYKVYICFYTYNCEITNIVGKDWYYSTNGLTSVQADATAVSQGTTIDFEIPTMRSISGKIEADGYQSIAEIGKVDAYFKSESGSWEYGYAYVDSNLNYTCYIEDDDLVGNYALGLVLGGKAVSNIVSGTYWHGSQNTYLELKKGENITGKNITAETGYAVSGKIIAPRDVKVSGYKLSLSVGLDYNTADCSQTLTDDNREIPYMLAVAKTDTDNKYLTVSCGGMSSSGNNPYTNLYTNSVYRSTDTTSTTESTEAHRFQVTSDITNMNITLLSAAVVNIEIAVPEGLESSPDIYITLEDENGTQLAYQSVWLATWRDTADAQVRLSKSLIGTKMYVSYQLSSYDNVPSLYAGKLYINPDGSFAHSKASATPHLIAADQTIAFTPAGSDLATKYLELSKDPDGTFRCKVCDVEQSDQTAILVFANYYANGVLRNVAYHEVNLSEQPSKLFTNTNDTSGFVKVMLLESWKTLKPLTASQSLEY